MHPAFFHWWKSGRRHPHACGPHASPGGCGPGAEGWGHPGPEGPGRWASPDEGGGGPFGVRRPLRFLAHKLDLTDEQVAELARIVEALKTERAQAEVDQRRTTATLADVLEAGAFDAGRAAEAGDLRVRSAERVRDAVVRALTDIHALLTEEQRKRFSYLLRTGVVSL